MFSFLGVWREKKYKETIKEKENIRKLMEECIFFQTFSVIS